MALCIDTETTVVDAISASMIDVFSMMVGEEVVATAQHPLASSAFSNATHENALTIVMGFSGDLVGSLCLCLPEKAALRWAELLIEHQSTEIDQVVVDAASELANIIVGGVKRRLSDYQVTMSLPSAIRAGESSLVFASNILPIQVGYRFCNCDLSIVVALVRAPA